MAHHLFVTASSIHKSLASPSKPVISLLAKSQGNSASPQLLQAKSTRSVSRYYSYHPSTFIPASHTATKFQKYTAMSSPPPTNNSNDNPFVIYAIAGSQFVFKVLAAIESRNIKHYVELVSMDTNARKQILNRKDGKASVPVLCTTSSVDNFEQIEDSEEILHWLDTNFQSNLFPPKTNTSEVSKRASDKTLAAMVWYYNWVDYAGYTKSMKVSVAKFVPMSSILPGFVLDLFVKSARDKFRYQTKKVLEVDDAVLDDEKQMRSKLIEELTYFQSLLKDSNQEYLIEGTTEPTAADFSVYAQLERLVGEAMTASDYDIQPALLELKYEQPTKESLDRLWKWHDNIRTKFPVHFKGKRPPKELLEQIQQQQQQLAQSKL